MLVQQQQNNNNNSDLNIIWMFLFTPHELENNMLLFGRINGSFSGLVLAPSG